MAKVLGLVLVRNEIDKSVREMVLRKRFKARRHAHIGTNRNVSGTHHSLLLCLRYHEGDEKLCRVWMGRLAKDARRYGIQWHWQIGRLNKSYFVEKCDLIKGNGPLAT